MARVKGFQHKRATTETVIIHGLLSEDGKQITYMDDKTEKTANIADYIEKFAGEVIEFKISIKDEDEVPADEQS